MLFGSIGTLAETSDIQRNSFNEAFKEAGDVFDPDLSSKLRSSIYSMGSTEEAMDLFVEFRGRKPVIEPLLKVRGLDGSE